MIKNASVPRLMQMARIQPNFPHLSPALTPSQRTGSTGADISPFARKNAIKFFFTIHKKTMIARVTTKCRDCSASI